MRQAGIDLYGKISFEVEIYINKVKGNEMTDQIQNQEVMEAVPNKSKNKVIGIVLAVVVVCIAGVVAANTLIPNMMPSVFVAQAFKTTKETLTKESKTVDELLGTTLSMQILESEAIQTSFGLNFGEVQGLGTEDVNKILKGMGISGEIKRDTKDKNIQGNLAINQANLEIIGTQFYKNGAEVGFSIPQLFNHYIGVNLDTFVEDYNQSFLYTLTGEPIDEEQYNTFKEYLDSYQSEIYNKALVENISKRTKTFYETADVKYIGKTNITGGDQDNKYKEYQLSLKSEDVKSYIKDLYTICMEDPSFVEYIKTLDAMQNSFDEESLSDTIEQNKEAFNEAINQIEGLDLKTTLKIDNKKHIVEAQYETTMTVDGDALEVVIRSTFTGNKFMTDGWEIAVDVKGGAEQAGFNLVSTSNYGEGQKQLVHHIDVDFKQNQTSLFGMKFDFNYDTQAKEDNLAINLTLNDTESELLTAQVKGALDINKSNKQINVKMDEIKVASNQAYMDYSILLSGYYNTQSIKKSDLSFEQQEVTQLFKMTENELMSLGEQISMGMIQLGSAFMY